MPKHPRDVASTLIACDEQTGKRYSNPTAWSILYFERVRARWLALASRSASGKRRTGSEFNNPLFLFALARLSSASTSTGEERKSSFFDTISLSRCTGIEGNFLCVLSRITKNGFWSVRVAPYRRSPLREHFRLSRAAGNRKHELRSTNEASFFGRALEQKKMRFQKCEMLAMLTSLSGNLLRVSDAPQTAKI